MNNKSKRKKKGKKISSATFFPPHIRIRMNIMAKKRKKNIIKEGMKQNDKSPIIKRTCRSTNENENEHQ